MACSGTALPLLYIHTYTYNYICRRAQWTKQRLKIFRDVAPCILVVIDRCQSTPSKYTALYPRRLFILAALRTWNLTYETKAVWNQIIRINSNSGYSNMFLLCSYCQRRWSSHWIEGRMLKELSIRLLNSVGLQLKQLSISHIEKNKMNISPRGA
jgi:hypothetical protein